MKVVLTSVRIMGVTRSTATVLILNCTLAMDRLGNGQKPTQARWPEDNSSHSVGEVGRDL